MRVLCEAARTILAPRADSWSLVTIGRQDRWETDCENHKISRVAARNIHIIGMHMTVDKGWREQDPINEQHINLHAIVVGSME
jgi:hypothetical protein